MKDRVPANPGRVLITPEGGGAAFYATMTRADNPTQEGDPLNKNTLLKDSTAALFGLGNDAVPDDALEFLGEYNQHWWRRRTRTDAGTYGYTKKSWMYGYARAIHVSDSPSTANIYQVADSISINQSTGEITLDNPTTISGSYGNPAIELKGKYFINTSESQLSKGTGTIIEPNTIYFLSADASFNKSSSGGVYYVTLSSNSYIYTVESSYSATGITYGDWEYLRSDTSSTYPHSGMSDGYEYEYLGIPFENAVIAPKIATGSYVGTGTYGVDGAVTLTFDFTPKFVFIQNGTSNSLSILLLANGVTQTGDDTSSGASNAVTMVIWGEKSVSWYAKNSGYQANAKNASGTTYYYVAIC